MTRVVFSTGYTSHRYSALYPRIISKNTERASAAVAWCPAGSCRPLRFSALYAFIESQRFKNHT
eukprot:103337-Prymnesium_polylepis.1